MVKFEELEVYKLSSEVADLIWGKCKDWGYYEKSTIGKQMTRSADSICANIAEGYGRFHFKERINFLYFARGSLTETQNWIIRAKQRDILKEEEFIEIKKIPSSNN